MAASPYLVQALQALSQPAQQAQGSGLSLQQMHNIGQQAQAWQAQNPGQSYVMHGLGQMGQNLMNAPGNAVNGLRNLVSGLGGQMTAPAGYVPPTGLTMPKLDLNQVYSPPPALG